MHNNDDMIERFLEGQTSNEENEALFHSLASDSVLQAEFRTSVGIRRIFEHEAATIKAPPAVLDSLMATATASGLIPPAPAVTAPAAGSISGGIIKLFILLGAMIIGAALYPVLFRNDEATTGLRPATAQDATGEPSMNRGVETRPAGTSASNDDNQRLATSHGAEASHTIPRTEVMTDGEPVRSSTTTVIAERPSHRSSSARTTSSRKPSVSNVTTLPVQPASTDIATTATGTESDEASISPSMPIATFESTVPVLDPQHATADLIALSDDASTDSFSRFEFRFHSQALGRQIGGTIDGVSPMANFGGELGYRFDDISSAGLGFYHVVMPQDTAIFMRWWGAYYRATPDIGLPFQLRPYLQATVGGCERGIVMAPSIGLTMPIGMFSLSLGADVTALVQNAGNGTVSYTVRPAMRFAVGITF